MYQGQKESPLHYYNIKCMHTYIAICALILKQDDEVHNEIHYEILASS